MSSEITSKKTIFIRSEQGIVYESSSVEQYEHYDEDEYFEEEYDTSPQFAIYEILFHAITKQMSKPFQLLKQFILFSDDDSSQAGGYKPVGTDMEIVAENIYTTCARLRQKRLMAGFISIKMLFEKRQRIQEVYYNESNLEMISESMYACRTSVMRSVFWEMYDNLKVILERFPKISLSKISETVNHDNESKEIDENMRIFLEQREDEVQEIQSFTIEQENHQMIRERQLRQNGYEIRQEERRGNGTYFSHGESGSQERSIQKRGHLEGIKIQKKESYKSYEMDKGRLRSEKSMDNPKIKIEEGENRTEKKQTEFADHESTHRRQQSKEIEGEELQQIYLIRDFSKKKKGAPTNFIKIPLATENVKIIEIQTDKKKKQRREEQIQKRLSQSEHKCYSCKFCGYSDERKKIMEKVRSKLEIYKLKGKNGTVDENGISQFVCDLGDEVQKSKRMVYYDGEDQRSNEANSKLFHEFKEGGGREKHLKVHIRGGQLVKQNNFNFHDKVSADVNVETYNRRQVVADTSRSAVENVEYEIKQVHTENYYEDVQEQNQLRQKERRRQEIMEIDNLAMQSRESLDKKTQKIYGHQSSKQEVFENSSREIIGGYMHTPSPQTRVYSKTTQRISHDIDLEGQSGGFQMEKHSGRLQIEGHSGGFQNNIKSGGFQMEFHSAQQGGHSHTNQEMRVGKNKRGEMHIESRNMIMGQQGNVGSNGKERASNQGDEIYGQAKTIHTGSKQQFIAGGNNYSSSQRGANIIESKKVSSEFQRSSGNHQKEVRNAEIFSDLPKMSTDAKQGTTIKKVEFISHEAISNPQKIKTNLGYLSRQGQGQIQGESSHISHNVKTSSGMTGGMISGMKSEMESEMTGGMKSGMTGSIKSSTTSGMTSGMVDGMTTGMKSGMKSGNSGMKSGMASGMTNVRTGGMKSRMTDGKRSGMTSGMTGGMNGMTQEVQYYQEEEEQFETS